MIWTTLALLLLAGPATADEPDCGDLDACQLACERRADVAACLAVGHAYDRGEGVDEDKAGAIPWYEAACAGGSAPGCLELATRRARGTGVERDLSVAAQLYDQACEGGEGGGCVELGFLASHGVGVEVDPARAARLFARGCRLEVVEGCIEQAFLMESGHGVQRDRARADRLFSEYCDDGNRVACTAMAVLLDDTTHLPEGTEVDLALSAKARRSCARNDPAGCYLLALTFRDLGYLPQAIRLLSKACDAGHGTSCQELARRFREGDGVVADDARAAEFDARRRGGSSTAP